MGFTSSDPLFDGQDEGTTQAGLGPGATKQSNNNWILKSSRLYFLKLARSVRIRIVLNFNAKYSGRLYNCK